MAWTVDIPHSSVEFAAKHMMISTVRGGFEKFDIKVNLNEANIEQSSVEATIDAASINTRDARRDAHLRSADFFAADEYPQLTFRSTQVKQTGTNTYTITGDLTIRGETHPVTFKAESAGRGKDPWGNEHWGFNAETTINRKDWNLNWNVALETGGWLVSDNIKISLELELVPSKEDVAEEVAAESTVSATA